MYAILGWINIGIIVIITSPFWLKRINKHIFNNNRDINKVVKGLRKLHKPLGISLVLLGIIHGYLALGAIKLHTGIILLLSIMITVTLGGIFYRKKYKVVFQWHKRMALIAVILVLIHLIFPGLFS